MRTLLLTAFAVLVMLAGPAVADDGFHKVPASGKKKASKKIKLRVVRYDGGVNGQLTVEVKNTGSKAAKFDARGLYFVPDVDADDAPQRLGAVGPMTLAGAADELDDVTIAAGDTVTVTLDVFCIDSHRDSPTSETPFTVGKRRMPASLARDVDRAGRKAAKAAGGFDDEDAFDDVQHAVWKVRDKDWVQLEGEGVQEADK